MKQLLFLAAATYRLHAHTYIIILFRTQQKMVYGVTYVEEGDETGGVGNSPQ